MTGAERPYICKTYQAILSTSVLAARIHRPERQIPGVFSQQHLALPDGAGETHVACQTVSTLSVNGRADSPGAKTRSAADPLLQPPAHIN